MLTAHRALVLLFLLFFSSPAIAAGPDTPRHVLAIATGDAVTVTWPPSSSGSAPLGYLVEASLSPAGRTIAAFLVIEPTLTVTAVPPGSYYVRVRAGNALGLSAPSAEVLVAVPGAAVTCEHTPGSPTGLRAGVAGTLVTLTWSAPAECPAVMYVVQAGSTPFASDLALFNVTGLIRGTIFAPVLGGRRFVFEMTR
jgi:hypothetical protein